MVNPKKTFYENGSIESQEWYLNGKHYIAMFCIGEGVASGIRFDSFEDAKIYLTYRQWLLTLPNIPYFDSEGGIFWEGSKPHVRNGKYCHCRITVHKNEEDFIGVPYEKKSLFKDIHKGFLTKIYKPLKHNLEVLQNVKGRYNQSYFEKNPMAKNRPAILYFLQFDGYRKIGITTRKIQERFPSDSFEILLEKKTTLYDAWVIEQKIKYLRENKWLKYTYEPFERKGDGRTECFTNDVTLKMIERTL